MSQQKSIETCGRPGWQPEAAGPTTTMSTLSTTTTKSGERFQTLGRELPLGKDLWHQVKMHKKDQTLQA